MGIFRRKKKTPDRGNSESLGLGFEGKEVHINPSPGQRQDRNLARMNRVKMALKKMEEKGQDNTARYELFRRELALRKAQADFNSLQMGG